MKTLGRNQPREGGGTDGVFITHLTGTSRLFRGFSAKKEEFRRPGSAQMGDEKRFGAVAPVWLTGFPRFSSPC
jgi:hypothetical protein